MNRPTPIKRDLAVHGGEWTAGPYFLVNTALGHANSDSGNEGATLKSSFPSTSVVNKVGKIKVPFCCWGTKLTAVRATPAQGEHCTPRAAAARQPRQRVPDTCALRLRPLTTAPARRARPRRQTGSPRRRYLGVLHQNLRSALDAVPRRRRRRNEAASKPLNRWPPDIARALLDRIVCVCVRSPACDGGVRRRRARTAPHF